MIDADIERSSSKDKADIFIQLSKSAQERFNVHHSVEWKVHFGLWTLYVIGAAALTKLDKDWNSLTLFIISTALAAAIFAVYSLWWLPHSHKYREECTRKCWWFEMWALHKLIPEKEEKENILKGGLHQFPPDGWPVPWPNGDKNNWGKLGFIHQSQWMALAVTFVLLLLFLTVAWTRYAELPDYNWDTGLSVVVVAVVAYSIAAVCRWLLHKEGRAAT